MITDLFFAELPLRKFFSFFFSFFALNRFENFRASWSQARDLARALIFVTAKFDLYRHGSTSSGYWALDLDITTMIS